MDKTARGRLENLRDLKIEVSSLNSQLSESKVQLQSEKDRYERLLNDMAAAWEESKTQSESELNKAKTIGNGVIRQLRSDYSEKLAAAISELEESKKHWGAIEGALKAEADTVRQALEESEMRCGEEKVAHDALKARAQVLQTDNESLQAALVEKQQSLTSTLGERDEKRETIWELEGKLKLTSASLADEEAMRRKAEFELQEAKCDLLKSRESLQTLGSELAEVKGSKAELEEQHQTVTGELEASKAQASSANEQLAAARREVSDLRAQMVSREDALTRSQREREELQSRVESLERGEGEREEALHRAELMRTQLNAVEEKLIAVVAEAEEYRTAMEDRWSSWATWTAGAVTGSLAASIGILARVRA